MSKIAQIGMRAELITEVAEDATLTEFLRFAKLVEY
jgi:hypothetical protein